MKKEDLPQDKGAIKDLCYVVDERGNYTTGLSDGWEIKVKALDVAWDDIKEKTAAALAEVKSGKASPIKYYMERSIMDVGIVAAYTGFWRWQVKRHLKPGVFKNLNDKKLKKYADLFEIELEELKKMGEYGA
ncbi:MAG: hypothetical protein HC819_06470 [Cyclobacteriaceae bacterium]|nr:hypothetical protein [Cyclobacteriaceae bacterium]